MNFTAQFQPHQRNTETKYFKNSKYKFEFLMYFAAANLFLGFKTEEC